MRNSIRQYWNELCVTLQAMPFRHLERAANLLLDGYRRNATVFVVGNGGSAATASHFACDLAKGTRVDELPRFRVLPLTDNVPLMTAWANDTTYDRIFAEQLAPHVQSGDILIAISASGNSPNVLAAAVLARAAGAVVIALTDQSGGKLSRLAHLAIRVPSDATQQIEQVEDAHMVIAHSLCVTLRARLRREAALRNTDPVSETA
jgi:D-sedoheptulose 7-phosphate isomerase